MKATPGGERARAGEDAEECGAREWVGIEQCADSPSDTRDYREDQGESKVVEDRTDADDAAVDEDGCQAELPAHAQHDRRR